MTEPQGVLEYKCPCCNAGLVFRDGTRELKCDYCGNTFDIEAVRAYADSQRLPEDHVTWEDSPKQSWSDFEFNAIRSFQCPACGGEILTDDHTAATFCPYCDNPAILPSRLSGSLRPDAVLPFQTGKEDAKAAFLKLCRGKPLLPKGFTDEQRLDRITGVYIPFWLYDCNGALDCSYKATRAHHWTDAHYIYTKTDHFLLRRSAQASFSGIPMDGSSKADDTFMESIEPYDYSLLQPFDMAYLSGYLADKYDVPAEQGESRIRQRVDSTMNMEMQVTLLGYDTVLPTSRQLRISNSRARYVLLPVWILSTNYRGKLYTFIMNGQTGKLTGTLPACPKRTAAWFAGVTAGVTLITALLRVLL